MLHATIKITRYFQECEALVCGRMTAPPEKRTWEHPGCRGEVEVEPRAECVRPDGRKFKAWLSSDEIGIAENKLLDAYAHGDW